MTREEIADFLETTPAQVELLWSSGVLKRSLHCAFRPVPDLSYSSVYDVLEFALGDGYLLATLSPELAAFWTWQLAEADEWESYERATMDKKISMLLSGADEDGLAGMTRDSEKVAAILILTQAELVNRCTEVGAEFWARC